MSIALRPIDHVLDKLRFTGTRDGTQHKCACPAHEDNTESLSVTEGADGKVLIHCFAGCKTEDVVARMGLTMADLMPNGAAYTNGNQKTPLGARVPQGGFSKPKKERAKTKLGAIVATYDYVDESGTLLYQATRHDPKDFRQRQPDGKGGWVWSITTPPVRKVLYRLPELIAADPKKWVYLVEGEKDANNLTSLGAIATCNAMGAGKWDAEYTKTLTGRRVCILPDADLPGQQHAAKVMAALKGNAVEAIVLNLPGLSDKEDVSDWIERGGTLAELQRLTQEVAATTTQTQPVQAPTPTPAPTFTEYSDLATAEFAYSLFGKEVIYTPTHGWMRNVGTHLTTDQAEAHAQRRVNDALRQQASLALATGNTELLKRSIPDARNTRSALYQFKSLVTISTGDLDGEPHLLNTLSGVVDLRSGDLVAGEMSNRFTYCVQTEYDRGSHILTTPLFATKLVEWFNQDLTTINFVERVLGYGITGETKEEIFVWLQGQRRSGKGTILNTIQELLGSPLAMSLSMKSLTTDGDDPQHFALAPLRPSRFVVASESKQHQRLDSGLLKWITGRDTIQVAHKGKDPFQMKPQFKLFAMSNYLPNIDAGDDAMHGRVKIIKMPNSYYGTEDKDLKAALLSKEQRELLLSMLVAQAGFYYKMGLVVPQDIEARAEEVRRAANPVYGWMGEAIIAKPGNSEILNDWYQSYCAWCEEWGFKPTQKGWFARTLNEAGYPTKSERPRDATGKKQSATYVMDGQLDH